MRVGRGVKVGVNVSVGRGVRVGVEVDVFVGVNVNVNVGVGVFVGVLEGVKVAVGLGSRIRRVGDGCAATLCWSIFWRMMKTAPTPSKPKTNNPIKAIARVTKSLF